jgi:hypothetical protein
MRQITESQNASLEAWFDDFVSTLRTHQVQLETNTASKEVENLYSSLLSGDVETVFKTNKETAQKFFVGKIILEYLNLLGNDFPQKLAFDHNDSEVLVWAEIEDDREDLEKKLIIAEAKINAKYHEYGFDMSTTIVENSDAHDVPNHYKSFKA